MTHKVIEELLHWKPKMKISSFFSRKKDEFEDVDQLFANYLRENLPKVPEDEISTAVRVAVRNFTYSNDLCDFEMAARAIIDVAENGHCREKIHKALVHTFGDYFTSIHLSSQCGWLFYASFDILEVVAQIRREGGCVCPEMVLMAHKYAQSPSYPLKRPLTDEEVSVVWDCFLAAGGDNRYLNFDDLPLLMPLMTNKSTIAHHFFLRNNVEGEYFSHFGSSRDLTKLAEKIDEISENGASWRDMVVDGYDIRMLLSRGVRSSVEHASVFGQTKRELYSNINLLRRIVEASPEDRPIGVAHKDADRERYDIHSKIAYAIKKHAKTLKQQHQLASIFHWLEEDAPALCLKENGFVCQIKEEPLKSLLEVCDIRESVFLECLKEAVCYHFSMNDTSRIVAYWKLYLFFKPKCPLFVLDQIATRNYAGNFQENFYQMAKIMREYDYRLDAPIYGGETITTHLIRMFVHPSIGEIVFKEHDVVFSESTILDNYDVLGKLIDAHCFCALTGLKAFNDRVEFFYGSKEKFREVFASYLERASVSKNTSLSYTLCEYDLMDVVAEELRRVGWSFQEKNYKPAPKIEDIDSTLS